MNQYTTVFGARPGPFLALFSPLKPESSRVAQPLMNVVIGASLALEHPLVTTLKGSGEDSRFLLLARQRNFTDGH